MRSNGHRICAFTRESAIETVSFRYRPSSESEQGGLGIMSHSDSASERRRYDRATLTLSGRYMLADGQEFDCQVIDVSPVGVAIRGPLVGDPGERVVVYVQELGRIEGVVVRRSSDSFAMDLRVCSNKLHKLAARIDWLIRRQTEDCPERRSFVRFDREEELTTLQLSDGRAFAAALLDVSTNSAALEVGVTPPVGAAVTVAARRAHVSRHFAGGIAVTFDQEAAAKNFDEIEAVGPRGARIDGSGRT
jgi:hypothetical protein